MLCGKYKSRPGVIVYFSMAPTIESLCGGIFRYGLENYIMDVSGFCVEVSLFLRVNSPKRGSLVWMMRWWSTAVLLWNGPEYCWSLILEEIDCFFPSFTSTVLLWYPNAVYPIQCTTDLHFEKCKKQRKEWYFHTDYIFSLNISLGTEKGLSDCTIWCDTTPTGAVSISSSLRAGFCEGIRSLSGLVRMTLSLAWCPSK